MRRPLFLRTVVVSGLLAVAVSMAVVVARGGGEGGNGVATGLVAQPAGSPVGPSGGRWKRGVQPLVNVKQASRGINTNCPKRTRSRRLPADFPASFPLPKSLVLTQFQRPTSPGSPPLLYVIGHARLSLRGAATFFMRELPLHGYYITRSESEAVEAEAAFAGLAKGALKVVAIPRCSTRVWMLVGVTNPRRAASTG